MLVGILSDTHDNLSNLRKAVDVFNNMSVSLVLHAGDFTSGFTFRVLKDLQADFKGIFGNNDGDVYFLTKMSQNRIFKQPYEFVVDSKKGLMIHEHFLVDSLAASGQYDILIYGHTHNAHVEKIGKTLIINPGETCGWLHQRASVAVLDTNIMDVSIVEL
ncbi:MAG: metallophosphoesterase [Candidatus Magnetoovum sp. WYHC-5]|nr:metallophosphoesterase [Candidatus Magnetoovum sp. WYHC-5]